MKEIYAQPYSEIDWPSCRNLIAECDLAYPLPAVLKALNYVSGLYEKYFSGSFLRSRAVDKVLDIIRADDDCTDFITIGAVGLANRSLQMRAICW